MTALTHEIKQAFRGATAQPGFSTLVVGVLAIGLACVLFMLIIIGSLVMRPLPFPDAQQLEHVGLDSGNSRIGRLDPIRDIDVPSLRRHLSGIAQVSGFQTATINLSDLERPQRFDGAFVTGNLFKVLQVAPALGRDFDIGDEGEGAAAVVMLSHALWTSRYGADPSVIGRQVRANSQLATIVGVMPADFSYPRRETIWMPSRIVEGARSNAALDVVIRRASDASAAAVRMAIANWHADAALRDPEMFRRNKAAVEPLAFLAVHAGTRAVLGVMLVATLLVLLIACANAANLLLTRTLARQHELAIRVALGASRRRLSLHLIAQTLLLALVAAGIALLVASVAARGLDQLLRTTSDGPPLWIHFELDARIVAMTLGLGVLTALFAGLIPALRAGGQAMAGHLRDSSRTTGKRSGRVSRILMIAEVALSLTLLIAVGTLVRSVMALQKPDLGIDTKGILTARIGLFESSYPTGADQVRLFERVTERLRADPSVIDAAAGTNLPGLDGWTRTVVADGADIAHDGALPQLNFAAVDDHYRSTYAIHLAEGRFFDSRDAADTSPVAVVDRRFAEQFGDSGDVIGRRFTLDSGYDNQDTVTVVGIVDSLQLDSPVDPPRPILLTPLRQQPARFASLAIRVKGDPAAFTPRLVEAIRSVDADTPAYWVRTYDDVIREHTFDTRLLAGLFAVFGVLALLLAAAGLYGVIAFHVGQRTREIGVQRALGASSATVLRSVLARTGWQMGIGLLGGVVLGLALTRALVNALHGIPSNPASAGGVLGVAIPLLTLLLAAVVAVILPARRALRVDPMVALRHE